MTSALTCRDRDQLLSAYVDHETSLEQTRQIEDHLLDCADCAARLSRLQRLAGNLDLRLQQLLTRGENDVSTLERSYRPPPQFLLANTPVRPFASVGVLLVFAVLVGVVLLRSAPSNQPLQTASQPAAPTALPTGGPVLMISVDGLVDPPVARYVQQAVATAETQHAAALVVELTPSGGLADSVQAVDTTLRSSGVPTMAYAPPGQLSPTASAIAAAAGGTLSAPPAGGQLLEMDFLDAVWHRVLDPTTAYLFFVLGLYAIFLEIAHPGALAPGISGIICMAVAAVAFSTLPTNWVGVVVLVAGVGLMGAELKAARHGVLMLAGVVCLGVGSLMLYAVPGSVTPALAGVVVAPAVLIAMVLVGLVLGVVLAQLAQRIHLLPPVNTHAQLIGARGVARTGLAPDGVVHVQGQLWSAHARGGPVAQGDTVRVIARRGLILDVESARQRAAATQKGALS